jgi:hypothetical protein
MIWRFICALQGLCALALLLSTFQGFQSGIIISGAFLVFSSLTINRILRKKHGDNLPPKNLGRFHRAFLWIVAGMLIFLLFVVSCLVVKVYR